MGEAILGTTRVSLLDDIDLRIEQAVQRGLTKAAKRRRNDQGTGDPRLGEVLREHRDAAALSLRELGAEAKLDPGFLSKVEKGERGLSSLSLAKLQPVLGRWFVEGYLTTLLEIES